MDESVTVKREDEMSVYGSDSDDNAFGGLQPITNWRWRIRNRNLSLRDGCSGVGGTCLLWQVPPVPSLPTVVRSISAMAASASATCLATFLRMREILETTTRHQ